MDQVGPESIDRAWAERVASRLQADLGALVAEVPLKSRTATGMARILELQVPLCHRVIAGVRHRGKVHETLATFPGVEGLRKVLTAMRRVGIGGAALDAAEAAVEEYEALISASGGSQRRLISQLNGADPVVPAARPRKVDEARRAVFEGTAEQLGCVTSGLIGARVYTPAESPRFPGDLDVSAVVGRVGFVRTSTALPLIFGHSRYGGDDEGSGDGSEWLIEEFTTSPLPAVTLERRGAMTVGVVDPLFERTTPVDVFGGLFHARQVIEREEQRLFLCSVAANLSPAEWMLQDVYVPAEFARNARVRAAAFTPSMGQVHGDIAKRWYDRLPLALTPGLLGHGIGSAASERHPRQQELLALLFGRLGLDPEGFVGFRLEVAYPLLFAQYVLAFEVDVGAGSSEAPAKPGA